MKSFLLMRTVVIAIYNMGKSVFPTMQVLSVAKHKQEMEGRPSKGKGQGVDGATH